MASTPRLRNDYRHSSARRSQIATERTHTALGPEQEGPAPWEARPGGPVDRPRLVWNRSEETREGRYAPAGTPLYEHERIEPAVWLASLAKQRKRVERRARGGAAQIPMDLAPRFDPDSMTEDNAFRVYRYDRNWMNRLIRGGASEVMASLLAKERMAGQVQAVYMDPPYGIDFKRGLPVRAGNADEQEGVRCSTSVKCFTDRYRDGVHSYLDGLYREFLLARDLLTPHGSLFVQIGRVHVHRLALVLDEVFGEENRVTTISFSKGTHTSRSTIAENGDYILWYCKDADAFTAAGFTKLHQPVTRKDVIQNFSSYVMVHAADGSFRRITDAERENPDLIPDGDRVCQRMPLSSQGHSTSGRSEPYLWKRADGRTDTVKVPPGMHWPISIEGLDRLNAKGGASLVGSATTVCFDGSSTRTSTLVPS